jgi:hypothetical protein
MLDGMGREEMRAADADRHAVADKLRVALDEGRLDLHEYDERLQQAYAAKTYGDLDQLLTDLPNAAPVAVPSPTPAAPARRNDHVTAQWLAYVWSSWFPAVMITSTIWAVASLAAGELQYYWPIWVAGPWGVVLVWQTIGGLASGQPQKLADARERKELAKQRKRERKALEAEAIASGEPPPSKIKDVGTAAGQAEINDGKADDATDWAKVRDGRPDEAAG